MSLSTSTTSLPSTNSSSNPKSNPEPSFSRPPLLLSERIAIPDLPPPHHVLSPAPGSTWSSYLPHWNPVPEKSNQDQQQVRTGFCNPWPSAHKPTPWEVWENLEWGVAQDAQDPSLDPSSPSQESQQDRDQRREEEEKLQVTKPDFSYDSKDQVKTTWLGHAGVLLQLPPIGSQGSDSERPVRVLFDPIFSERCSPTQLAGPIRSYPAPCSISDLPPIDVVVISHSHYDHLDYNTIYELWNLNSSHLRFIVPLGNKSFFTSSPLSVPEDQVTELDWWDEVLMTSPSSSSTKDSLLKMDPMNDVSHLRLVCTPAQHGSGRIGLDANTTLWASWTLEYHSLPNKKKSNRDPFRIFFGGDTGYQFQSHQNPTSSSSTSDPSKEIQSGIQSANGNPPASASSSTPNVNTSSTTTSTSPSTYPVCPAFQQIASRLGSPHLLLLPISVGATISFLKSFDPIPPAWSPFPRIDPELNSSNHMGPEDAVRVMNLMTKEKENKSKERKWPVAVGIHWGTFVSGENEVKNSIRGLRSACEKRGVRFSREFEAEPKESSFVLINHGQSISQSIL